MITVNRTKKKRLDKWGDDATWRHLDNDHTSYMWKQLEEAKTVTIKKVQFKVTLELIQRH